VPALIIASGFLRTHAIVAAFLLAAVPLGASASEPLRNWYDDPFFQVRHAHADCPTPLGPLATEAEMRHDAHERAERGTRCWLAKECSKPNSYLYDDGIADAVRARFAHASAFRDATLWITVQRRFVWVEGCVARRGTDAALERFLRDVPDVERVIVNVATGHGKPPYRTLPDDARATTRP
jgi:hypothetical protein